MADPTAPLPGSYLTDEQIAALLQKPETRIILARVGQMLDARLLKLEGPTPLNQLANELNTLVPGWKTSEFWMTTAGHVGLILAALTGLMPAQWAALAAAASQAAYTISRGLAKGGQGN